MHRVCIPQWASRGTAPPYADRDGAPHGVIGVGLQNGGMPSSLRASAPSADRTEFRAMIVGRIP
jgi:hypothetical protein